MAWDLTTAKSHLNAWLTAELQVSSGQSYTIGSRSLTRANLSEISERIKFWQNEVKKLSNGRRGARVMRVVPRD
ncbi:DUF6148 family protein [Tumebacillus permanentifrigoris]|uniref:GpW protein n=1 Tax=Tumebacillus permanentifrigoris TaxID=378543 RepID=A0A316DET0_9BACL|nr:DUF6148 family protein [Tumebacillus permanentifrigoris]PWK16072.1 hypothetical protein C7459_102319 [Tumebacillus permanentifrigoris]